MNAATTKGKQMDYQGVLYDLIDEVIVERGPVIRGTYAEAMADAHALLAVVNAEAEAADDESDENTSVGRVDDSYCFVLCDGSLEYADPVALPEETDEDRKRASRALTA